MEGLIILLAELLAAALMAAAAVLWGGVAAIIAFFTALAGGRLWAKLVAWAGGIAGAVAVVIVAALFVLDRWYFEPTVRFIADRVGERTEAQISYRTVEGSLLEGRLTFTKFEAARTGHEERDFEFAVGRAAVDLDLPSLLPLATPTFDVVHLEKVSGRLVEHHGPEAAADAKHSGGGRPAFAVRDLRITDLSVHVEKAGGRRLAFEMPRIAAQPLRSEYALFDIMFRSTVEGTVSGHPVRITTSHLPEGRVTEWDIERMPVSVMAAFADRAPFNWFETGVADIRVRDAWQVGEVADIDMDWRFLFDEVRLAAPEGAGLKERALVLAARKFFEARDGRVDIAFGLVLNREEFRAFASNDAMTVFNAALDALVAAIAEEAGVSREEIKKDLFGAAKAMRDHLDRRRKEQEP